MELKWLEDFVSLANTSSFSKSAKQRNVTQPAFSRRIRALEISAELNAGPFADGRDDMDPAPL